MNAVKGFAVFILFVLALVLIKTGGEGGGIPLTGIDLPAFLAPNPAALDASANQDEASAAEKRAQAQAAREWSANATRTAAEERARFTEVARQVEVQQTAQARETQEAFARQVIGWTATADSDKATEAAAVRQTETQRAEAIVQATAAAEQVKQEKEAVVNDFVNSFNIIFWPVLMRSALFLAVVAAIGLTSFWGYRQIKLSTRFKENRKTQDGYAALIDVDKEQSINQNLQTTATMPTNGAAPQPTPTEIAVKKTQDQLDAVRAMNRFPQQPTTQIEQGQNGFKIVAPGKLPPLLEDPAIVKESMDQDWSKNGSAD